MWTGGGTCAETEAEKQVRAGRQRFDWMLRGLGLVSGPGESARGTEASKSPSQTGEVGTLQGWTASGERQTHKHACAMANLGK